nr:hypothetical protein [Brevundimonas diminuta]
MSIAVLTADPAKRARPRLKRTLTAGASLLMHVIVLGSMARYAADDRREALPPPPAPRIIQLELERPFVPPQPSPPLPAPTRVPTPPPTPMEAQPPQRTAAQPSPAPAPAPAAVQATPPPRTAPQAAPLPTPAPKAAPAPPAAALERAPVAPAVIAPIRPRKKDEEDGRDGLPAPPAPRLANPAPGAPSAAASGVDGVSDVWRVTPEGQSGRNARALRTSPAGCPAGRLLRRGEEIICDERFNARAAQGAENGRITGTGNAERDARFAREGARELQRYEAQRRPLSGGVGVLAPQDCPGSNFGTGCAGAHLDSSMQMDSNRNVQTRRDGAPASGRPMTPGAAGPREPMRPQ